MFLLFRASEVLLFVVTINIVKSVRNNTTCELKKFHYPIERFSSSARLVEANMFQTVKDAMNFIRRTLHIIERFKDEIKILIPDPMKKSSYLQYITESFALLNRISNMWPTKLSLMKMGFGNLIKHPKLVDFVNLIPKGEIYVPNNDPDSTNKIPLFYSSDTGVIWRSAIAGLVRLQETYNLSTADVLEAGPRVSSGMFNVTPFSAGDCYDVGVYCVEAGVPVRAVEWLLEASRRVTDNSRVYTTKILDYLHVAYCFIGEKRKYDEHLRYLLTLPFYSPNEDSYNRYTSLLQLGCRKLKQIFVMDRSEQIRGDLLQVGLLKGLCRKENLKPPTDHRLRCRMIHYNRPYLRICPWKMEELSIEPTVLVFHQVMTDSEIKALLEEDNNQTTPAIFGYNGYNQYHDTQDNIFISTRDKEQAKRWDKKAAMIANAALYKSVFPMLASYGIAGRIAYHTDLEADETLFDLTSGDYITLMYWLNQPAEGGFTVFPHLNLSVVPEKGSAVMWFNRRPNWEGDRRLDHTGCPVLRGSKWILTKWFHAQSMRFHRCVPLKERTREHYYLDSNTLDYSKASL